MLLALNAGDVLAAATNYGTNNCQPIYGGGQSCVKTPQFEINKTVQNPKTQAYVDNLGVSDPKFAPTQLVPFKISVKNTTDTRIDDVIIKDIMPEIVEFAGGIGDFDAKTRTLTIKLASLDAGETRDFYVQAKVAAKDKLPQDQNVMCVINQSTITKGDKTSQDNSQFCVEKTLPPTPTNPPTKGGVPTNPGINTPPTKGGVPTNPGTTTPPTTKGAVPAQPGTTTTATTNPTTTKGGLPIHPPTKATTTPPTGPMDIALLGLIPSAISGFILRRKTK